MGTMDTISLEFWMSNLPPQLRQIPLMHLAIPGSHDSMTEAITTSSKLAPDAEVILKRLRFLGPILRSFMYRWCRTQVLNATDQLKQGIRYFDLRVGTKKGSVYPYFVHGLYSNEVTSTLTEFHDFVDTHSEEVIILDFQHFYGFTNEDHRNLITLLNTIFQSKLLPSTRDMGHLTLDFLTRSNKYQVIIIYRSNHAYNNPFLWSGGYFPTPWPNTTSPSELVQMLDSGLANRSPNIAYVSQFLLTPTNSFIFKNLFSTLKKKCVIPLQTTKCEWIGRQRIGINGVNIIIADFVDLFNSQFAAEIIKLNYKSVPAPTSSLPPVD